MKIYTQTFDVAKQSPQRFWVAPFSDFKIGVKIVKNGTPIANEFTVKKNGVALEADADKVDGFTTFTLQSAGTGNVEYAIEVSGVGETMKLVQIVTDSTVFEVGGSGGGDVPADVATQTWVNSQISGFITDEALTDYVPLSGNVNMTGSLSVASDFNGVYLDPSNGVTVWDADEGKQKIVSLDYDGLFVKGYNDSAAKEIEYPTKSGTMLVDTDLTAYYTKSETSSAVEISNGLLGKVTGGAETGTTGTPAAIQAIKSVYETDWASLSATANPNTFYVVLPDPPVTTRVKYTTASGLPDWEGDIVGTLGSSSIPNKENAEVVEIGFHVTSIGENAFAGCTGLTSVTIPDSVTSLARNAFWGCNMLPSVTIPNTVTSLGVQAFAGCGALTNLTIPNSVTSIGDYGIFNCANLSSITIGSGVTSIGTAAFRSDDNLMSVTMTGKDISTVQSMSNYSWELPTGCKIHCTDGDITI